MALSSTVPRQDSASLREVFRGISPESCPRHFNFHMHTAHSDGKLKPSELVTQALALGLTGFAITDHHTVAGYREALRCLKADRAQMKPQLWPGIEINADLLGGEVHILGYGFDPDAAVLAPYLQGHTAKGQAYQAQQVIGALHAAGGLAVLAHPVRYRRDPADLILGAADLGIDGVETYYCYNNPTHWRPSPEQTALVHKLGERYQLLHTCGTDTHGRSLLARL
ncbi:PHP domain-containing protein [Leptolyngbya sp. FACHB-261]|uniref:PHP domain-containing protein n=1 Tax=Leptolyngbya sp. FACHB-261 TaxID=2692806 RepID=UPI0016877F8A|nr:PHP domain-containing protein [Leptolyngbya sp. FACHB-261]MBD2099842.1 PHP domain-containing protein [Leptolyngbya sp. FACHB-261]